jgi:hypothetical protein
MPDALTTSPIPARLAATRPPRAPSRGRGALSLFLSALLTYPRRPFLWCWPLANAVFCAFLSARINPTYDARTIGLDELPFDGIFFSTFLLACTVGFFAASVTGHFVQILLPPRGQVVPNLRRTAVAANIVLTVAIVLGFAAIWPRTVILFGHGSPQSHAVFAHTLPIVLVLAAQLAWTQYAPITGAFSLFAWGLLSFPQPRAATLRMLVGHAPALESAAILLGVGLFVGLWVLIARRRDRTFAVDPIVEAISRKLLGDDSRAAPGATVTPPLPTTIPALAPPRALTAAARRRLHRRAVAGGNSPLVAGAVVGLALVALVYFLRALGVENMDAMTPRVLLYMVSIIPAIFVSASAMENRGPLITHGLLLPRHRRQFVREIGLAMLTNLFTTWIAATLPILLLIILDVSPRVRPAPALLAAMLAIAAAYQVFALGVIAWLLRLTHRIVIMIAQAAGCAMAIPIVAANPNRMLLPTTLISAAVFLAIGVGFALTAYRTWADAEPPSAGPSKTAAAL